MIRTPSGFEPASLGDPALLDPARPAAERARAVGVRRRCEQSVLRRPRRRRHVPRDAPDERRIGRDRRPPLLRRRADGHDGPRPVGRVRLCVEALEIPEHGAVTGLGRTLETVVVATFAPDEAGRAEIELGSESRSALSCALTPR